MCLQITATESAKIADYSGNQYPSLYIAYKSEIDYRGKVGQLTLHPFKDDICFAESKQTVSWNRPSGLVERFEVEQGFVSKESMVAELIDRLEEEGFTVTPS